MKSMEVGEMDKNAIAKILFYKLQDSEGTLRWDCAHVGVTEAEFVGVLSMYKKLVEDKWGDINKNTHRMSKDFSPKFVEPE